MELYSVTRKRFQITIGDLFDYAITDVNLKKDKIVINEPKKLKNMSLSNTKQITML